MKKTLKKILRGPHKAFLAQVEKERFNPQFVGLFTNPFFIARRGLYREITKLAPRLSGEILDVGCGSMPYKKLFTCQKYTGMEVDTPRNREAGYADVFYDGTRFPNEEESYDGVFASQVLEHVFEPDTFLREIHRVLKKDGLLLLTVPFVWDEHEQPYDYARYSSFGAQHLLTKNGFEVIEKRKSVQTLAVPFQLISEYFYKKTKTQSLYLNLLFSFFFMAPWNILGTLLGNLLPDNEDLYLDNIILARKKG